MQKKLIALAIAGLSSAAFAQSNVTVYGVVDLGQAFVKGSNASSNQGNVGRLDSNSSHIGFKGSEALGNGLTAVFQYESGFAADTASALVGTRDTFIGLAGGFGTLIAGNLTHPLRGMGAKVELTPGAAGFGTTASVTGRIGGANTGADDRAPNAIAYVSPSFSGFTATVAYVNGEAKTNNTQSTSTVSSFNATTGTVTTTTVEPNVNARQWQVAGQYENGPLYVGLGYHKTEDFGYAEKTDAKVTRLAAIYNFPSKTKVTFLWDKTKVTDGMVSTFSKRNAWSLGAAQGFGAHTVGLEFASSADVETQAGKTDNGAKVASLVYTYGFSKRTMLHARYSKLTNDAAGTTSFYNNPVATPVAASAGVDFTGYMVGLRHNF